MVREIYHRRFGNPVIPELLPLEPLELELPVRSLPPSEVTTVCTAMTIIAVKAAVGGAILAQILHWIGWLHLPLLFGCACFAYCSPQRLPFLFLLGLTLAISPPLWPYVLPLLAPCLACLFFALTFVLHYAHLATAFPVPFGKASLLRKFVGLLLAHPALGLALLPITVIVAPLALLLTPLTAFRGCLRAWKWWIAYDFEDCPAAGVTRTPAGSVTNRRRLLLITILLATACTGAPITRNSYLNEVLFADPRIIRESDQVEPRPYLHAFWKEQLYPTRRRPGPDDALWNDYLRSVATFQQLPRPIQSLLIHPLILNVPFLGGLFAILLTTLLVGAPVSLLLTTSCRRDFVPPLPEHEEYGMIQTQVRRSSNPIERDSLIIGRNAHDHSPVLAPTRCFKSHAWLLGGTGGGKSAALSKYLEQLVAMGNCSVVLVDLKADTLELFESLRSAATQARTLHGMPMPLKWFSNRHGDSTFAFSPLLQPCWQGLTPVQQSDFIGTATATTYSQSYGEAYYSAASLHVLQTALHMNPNIASLRDLATTLDELLSGRRKNSIPTKLRTDASHVLMKLLQLSELDGLNVTAQSSQPPEVLTHAINLASLFQEPQLLYFGLPCAIGPSSSPDIARMVVYSLILTAASLKHRPVQVYLAIDEFQRCVANNLEFVLQTARSMGVGCILANQSMQDLQQGSINLLPAMESCTTFRQYFKLTSLEDMQRLSAASGKGVDFVYGLSQQTSVSGAFEALSKQQYLADYLSINETNLTTAHPKQSIVQITENAGYSAFGGFPFVVESLYHISPQEYERRKAASWPGATTGTLIQSSTPPFSATSQTTLSPTTPIAPSPIMGIQTIQPPPKPQRQPPRQRRRRRRP